MRDCDIVVTSYTLARLEADQWSRVALAGVVIDEAQAVKNPRTATYRALRDMDAPWRLAVSGTPIENSLGDLWSLLSLTCPGLLPGWDAFTQKVRRPIEGGDAGMAAIAWAYLEGTGLEDTARAAMAAGAIAMESAETINPDMSARLLRRRAGFGEGVETP